MARGGLRARPQLVAALVACYVLALASGLWQARTHPGPGAVGWYFSGEYAYPYGSEEAARLLPSGSRVVLDHLRATVVLPITRAGQVVGGLAVGPRASGDVYERAELHILGTLLADAGAVLGEAPG